MTEEGMPRKGIFDCTYYAGEGKCKNGCKPATKFRKALLQLVLIEEEEVLSESQRDTLDREAGSGAGAAGASVNLVGPAFIQAANPSKRYLCRNVFNTVGNIELRYCLISSCSDLVRISGI